MSTSDLNALRLVSAGHRHDADVTINNAVFAELIVRASTAEAKVKAVRELHKGVPCRWRELDGKLSSGLVCDYCTPVSGKEITLHPCPTITALDSGA